MSVAVPKRRLRGRHAPPREIRRAEQLTDLLDATREVAHEHGYAACTAEAISRAAGMSKATFYEHFANAAEALVLAFEGEALTVLDVGIEILDHAGFVVVVVHIGDTAEEGPGAH